MPVTDDQFSVIQRAAVDSLVRAAELADTFAARAHASHSLAHASPTLFAEPTDLDLPEVSHSLMSPRA